VLRIISPAASIRLKKIEAPVSPQTKREIPPSQFARIRALVKYGMTVSQVAEVYGTADGDIERILQQA
jgi:hypothetical protein